MDTLVHDVLQETGNLKRGELLTKLFTKMGVTLSESECVKKFKQWRQEELRYNEFVKLGPYDEIGSGKIHQWNPNWMNFPSNLEPTTNAPRNYEQGEHSTAPWWTTSDVWWPAISEDKIKKDKDDMFTQSDLTDPKSKTCRFSSEHIARQALQGFFNYLNLSDTKKESKKQPRGKSSGQMISPKTNGARRGPGGTYEKNSED